ncbi:MAG: hypothetical protein CL764_00035 [Chloroflexi bacterium]|nr:hypothetical protein [Chloroflexota bacterium]
MAGAIDKKIAEVKKELEDSPSTHLSARNGILSSVTLIREFSESRLNALCEKFTAVDYALYIQLEDEGTGNNLLLEDENEILMEASIIGANYSLAEICENLAKQRLICYGARDLQNTFRKFDLPSYETVNGALGLSEPNTSYFGIKATDIGETYSINLTSSEDSTQTQGSNTFSTYINDYYVVRSRVDGELVDINDDMGPYSTPNDDTPFGNAIAWGQSITTEAGTWNADYAKANIASVSPQSSGAYNELTVIRLNDHLTSGSNTSYTPVGPSFGQKFYLKRHEDHVNTFTITGTTTTGSLEITNVSDTDLAKIKYGDVIGGTGIPDDNVSIAAVQSAGSKIRLSNTGIATADGTVTITVNSVPFGYAKNDIFCQVEVVGEGLVKNPDWKPVGDDAGDYSGSDAGADDLLNANTSQFVGLLGFFDPDNGSSNATNDITKGARNDWVSLQKEISGTTYPYKERNPFFPAMGGTVKAYEVDNGEIVGTQPTGLGDEDIPSGRYIRFDYERANNSSVMPENRYYIDQAEKFYYEVPCTNVSYTCGTVTVGTNHTMPNVGEPPTTMTKTGLSATITRVQGTSVTCDGVTVSVGDTGDIPADTDTTHPALSGSSSPPSADATIGTYYTLGANNYIYQNRLHYQTVTTTSGTNWVATLATDTTVFPCRYNFVQKHLYEAGGSGDNIMNADVQFIKDTVNDLQTLAPFRDPIITGAQAGGSGIADDVFDTYIQTEPSADLAALSSALTTFRDLLPAQSRTGDDNSDSGKGTLITFANTTWAAFHTELSTFGTNCGKRTTEIDTRIGVPTRSGTQSSSFKQYPGIYVSAVPAANTTSGHVPYGRAIYDSCNYLLGDTLKLGVQLIQDIQGLTDLVDLVKKARNKYEIYNGRAKEYS